jgi:hypothetical protein
VLYSISSSTYEKEAFVDRHLINKYTYARSQTSQEDKYMYRDEPMKEDLCVYRAAKRRALKGTGIMCVALALGLYFNKPGITTWWSITVLGLSGAGFGLNGCYRMLLVASKYPDTAYLLDR